MEMILKNLISSTDMVKHQVLGYMMLIDFYQMQNKPDMIKKYCNKIISLPDQTILYIFLGEKIYTSHAFAKFILSRQHSF
jgi:hypothetical protein